MVHHSWVPCFRPYVVVPNATVELRNSATNASQTTKASSAGVYTFSAVPPGMYSVTTTASGFRKAVVSSVNVQVGKSALVNLKLEVGAATETVEVVGAA